MSKLCAGVVFAMLLAFPSWAQVLHGSLVVWIVSRQGDYVVIGAESRSRNPASKLPNDRYCKVISLGGDTLFYETGNAEIVVGQGKPPWNTKGMARATYKNAQNYDALSLSNTPRRI